VPTPKRVRRDPAIKALLAFLYIQHNSDDRKHCDEVCHENISAPLASKRFLVITSRKPQRNSALQRAQRVKNSYSFVSGLQTFFFLVSSVYPQTAH
jgi:hypothetical protein